MTHTINKLDFEDYGFQYELAASYGNDSAKRLVVSITIHPFKKIEYVVYSQRERIGTWEDIEHAIDAYNNEP